LKDKKGIPMHQYNRNLLVFALATVSALIVTPCYAQNAAEANKSSADNSTMPSASITEAAASTDTTVVSNLDDSKDSTKTNSAVISQNNSQSTTPKANPRVPVYSRIFPMAPLMRQ
jgi:hypothetical protein